MSLGLTLLSRAGMTPRAPALESAEGAWSYAMLAGRACRAARWILDHAADDDAPVALLLPGDAEFLAWFSGVALAGRPVLPLNGRLAPVEIAGQLDHARVRLLVCDANDPRLDDVARRCPGVVLARTPVTDGVEVDPDDLPGARAADDATLAVLYTSGTSGRPKGACLSWSNFAASALAASAPLGDAIAERWLACMPMFHVGGLSMFVRGLLFGAPLRLVPRFEPAAVGDALDAGDVAGVSLVPTMLSRLLEHRGDRAAPAALRVVLLGGAAAAPSLVRRALEAGWPVCPTYGLTEAASQVATASPPRRGATRPRPMLPLPDVAVRIDVDGRDAGPGEVGEILVQGPTVMRGYLHDDEATALALADGWLHTGDLGALDADGALTVCDRRDDLVVSGGENVYPAEVEAALHEHPSVAEAGVAGIPDPDLGARVVAWVVPRDGAPLDAATLDAHCRALLAGYKCPREYRFRADLPRTASGKLRRRALAGE
ncbi:MAG: AMP-binding protein [Steroidobacteraceae bacterium]